MSYQISTSIPESHPSLPGHFPGHPIVPGVVILDHVYSMLKLWHNEIELSSIPSVKFLQPIFPGMEFAILFEQIESKRYRFYCQNDGQVLVRGEFSTR